MRCITASLLVMFSVLPGAAVQDTDKTASWRTSFDEFVKAIAAFPIQNVPYTNPDRDDLSGLRVSADQPIMKRFGGVVEFAGTFQGVSRDWDSRAAKPTNRDRIDIEMAIPELPGGPTNWTIHLYPKAAALKAWKASAPKAPVKFRAVVTGVARNHAWLSGVDLRWYSILLEDGEIISQ